MSWSRLKPEDSKLFLEAVCSDEAKLLFENSICDVYSLPLDFYDGYSLVRVANKYTIPYMQFDFLSNGENHYYLDGSEGAFHNLNARGAISLNQENVYDYLNLYISYVYERGNSLGFYDDKENSSVTVNPQTGHYEISTPLSYQDSTVQAQISVTDSGAIHVQKPVSVSFLEELSSGSAFSILHPYSTDIIEGSKSLLKLTTHGVKLVALLEEKKAGVQVISSPNYEGFCSNMRTIYMLMPAEERTAKYLQALILAGAIRDMEQVNGGYMHPHPTENADVFGDTCLGKNLDMIIEMCKIVDELEAQNIPEGLHDFSKLGFGPIYQAYKAGQDEDGLMKLYLSVLEEREIIK